MLYECLHRSAIITARKQSSKKLKRYWVPGCRESDNEISIKGEIIVLNNCFLYNFLLCLTQILYTTFYRIFIFIFTFFILYNLL